MPSARQQLITLITSALTSASVDPMPNVIGFAAAKDITEPTVMVMPEEVIPTAAAPRGNRTYTFSVLAMASASVPTEEAEAQLDDLVADLLDALDWVGTANDVTWSLAKRVTYNQTVPAYLTTVTTPLVIE